VGNLGQSLTSRVRAILADAGNAHHQRRLLAQDLADLLITIEPDTSVQIILEDLRWSDELSLEVLGHVVRRIANRPMLARDEQQLARARNHIRQLEALGFTVTVAPAG
jgi:predicted ATPase